MISTGNAVDNDDVNDVEEDIEHPPSRSLVAAFQKMYSKLTLLEVSGSCGDFGTLFPLLVALARDRRIHLAPTLLLSGIVHLVTALYWDLPMPLQPMHMISAQAISQALTRTQVTTAGIGMGIAFGILQFGGIEWLHRAIPQSVIGGLQMGVGWKLALKALGMIQELPWWGTLDCKVGGILASVLVLYGLGHRPTSSQSTTGTRSFWATLREHPPMGIILFVVGLVLAGLHLAQEPQSEIQREPEPLLVHALRGVTWKDWSTGLLNGTLPQLPLTLLNSCLSVCLLAQTLFPDHSGNAVSRKSVSRSLGAMNALLCPFGLMPHCHGAGGLAGQHRLGANTGASMMALGVFKIVLSLIAAQGALLVLLDALPVSVLGVLLALSGHELATTGIKALLKHASTTGSYSTSQGTSLTMDQQLTHDITIALVTALVIVATGKAHVGSLCGWLAYIIYGTSIQDLFFGGDLRRRRRMSNDSPERASSSQYSPLTQPTCEAASGD